MSRSSQIPLRPEDFEFAIICALPVEYDAICLLFDKVWKQDVGGRRYKAGRIGLHNVVLALLDKHGKASAARTASTVHKDYRNIRLAFLVGICGGVPRLGFQEILLGDVVVSSGIFQYDFGKQYPGRYLAKTSLDDPIARPDGHIRNQLRILETDDGKEDMETEIAIHLKDLQGKAAQKRNWKKQRYQYPGPAEDKLFEPHYRHQHHQPSCSTCNNTLDSVCDEALNASCLLLECDEKNLVQRERLEIIKSDADGVGSYKPSIHIGLVGSGDTVIKSGEHRDELAKLKDNIVAFEMEGAGVSEVMQCIVVKGVCDYADSHKNKKWQNFAAATAASALKAIIESCPLINHEQYELQSSSPLSPSLSLQSTLVTTDSRPQTQASEYERTKRVNKIEQEIPSLLLDISTDLKRTLKCTPYIVAAPSAICVMATCLVAGSSRKIEIIEVNIPPMNI